MKHYPHIAARLYGAPLLLLPGKAAMIEEVFRASLGGIEMQAPPADGIAPPARPRAAYAGINFRANQDKPYALTESGIGIISVIGTLVNRGSWVDAYSGLVSYDFVATQLDQAMNDPNVNAVLLEFESYGGEGSGIVEMGDRIVSAKGVKPVWSIANETADSAAYWMACSAERVYVPITGYTGSIGAVSMFVDQSKRDSSQGYAYEFVYDGERKIDGNPHAALTDPARAWLQAEVRRFGLMFREHVAAMRGLTEAAVRATQAAVFPAPLALELGYVDGIGTIAETVGEMEDMLAARSASRFSFTPGVRAARQSTKEIAMLTKEQQAAAALSAAEQQAAETARIDAARAEGNAAGREAGRVEGHAAGRTEGHAAGLADGVKAERARIGGILTHAEAKERSALALSIATETDMSIEQAVKLLAAAPKQAAGSQLGRLMAGVDNPKVGVDTAGSETAKPRIDSKSIYDARKPAQTVN